MRAVLGLRCSSACQLSAAPATLLAFACALQATAQDDVLDVLDMLLTDFLLARVESQERRRRLRTIGDLDVAALLLRNVGLSTTCAARSSSCSPMSRSSMLWPQ
jgi:hypothetical protein